MKITKYPTKRLDRDSFQFFSSGPKGIIELRTVFVRDYSIAGVKLYNLSFGIWCDEKQDIDDLVETRNGDMDKILATVALTAIEFLLTNPKVLIFASGSTPGRTRKYQMGIAKHFHEISNDIEIRGLIYEATELE